MRPVLLDAALLDRLTSAATVLNRPVESVIGLALEEWMEVVGDVAIMRSRRRLVAV